MERQQDSIIMDAATRRNLEITQNLAGGVENTLASVLDSTVTRWAAVCSRWLHMPIRDTETLVGRQQTIAALQDRFTELQPVLRQVGDLERILARLACAPRARAIWRGCVMLSSSCRSCVLSLRREQRAGAKLRETMGEFTELRELLNAPLLMRRRFWCAMAALLPRLQRRAGRMARWQMAQRITSINWKSASASVWARHPERWV
jgi:DNA mismatch repair protein MutS